MLNTQELANFISSKLNEISSQQGFNYVFDLGAEVLENANDGHIKGILRTVSNNPMVIKDFVSAKIQYRVEFSIPVGRANKNLINIEKIIGIFVATYEDDEQAFTGGKASFEFTYAYSKDFSTQHSTGDTVPLGFDVVVNFTDTGLLGSSKVWMLNGVVIPYQTEAILLEKDGQTNRISEEYYNKSIMLAQSKFYKFTIPYDAGSSVCTTLQGDLLAGDFDKTYTLSYYDGVNYTSTAPYTTTVSIFRSGAANSDGGSISMFDITFADVSAAELDPKYTIELFSVPFDETNIRFFDGVKEQAQWYNNLPATQRTKAEQIKAPTLNSLHTTTQVYDYDGTTFSQIQLANMNVARINEKKDTQTSSSYQLNFTQETQYNGTITGNDGSSLDFEVVSTTPIIIDGVTYFLSVDAQGNYSLVDGGGNAITITNNQFVLEDEYYFVQTNDYYQIVDSNGNVITQLSTTIPVNITNISLTNTDSSTTYTGLTLVGAYDQNNEIHYSISNSTVSADINKRNLRRSRNEVDPDVYFWLDTTATTTTTTDPETQEETTQTTYSYKVTINGRPYFGGTGVTYDAVIGTAFVTLNGVQYTLQSESVITGSNGSTINMDLLQADYYEFKLSDDQFYMDTTDNHPITGEQSDYISFYDGDYSWESSFPMVKTQNFILNDKTYVLSVGGDGEVVKILRSGFIVADISQSHMFSLDTIYQIETTSTTTTTKGNIQQNGVVVAQIKTASSPYDYQFKIEGITYYIRKNTDVYNIYYQTGVELASNVQNGGTFAIPNGNYNYYYYTIENAELGADKQIILTLKLDTAQTYLVNPDVSFGDCFIEKTHLNRFLDNGDGIVGFNNGIESPLFEREDVKNVSKRLVSRKTLKYGYGARNEVEQWLRDNILGWVYAYFSSQKFRVYSVRPRYDSNSGQHALKDIDINNMQYYMFDSNYISGSGTKLDSQFVVFAAPIYKKTKKIIYQCQMPKVNYLGNVSDVEEADAQGAGKLCLDKDILMAFLDGGKNGPAYTFKFSTKPPVDFSKIDLASNFEVDSYGNLVQKLNTAISGQASGFYTSSVMGNAYAPYAAKVEDHLFYITEIYTIPKDITVSGENMFRGILQVRESTPTYTLEDYALVNPTKFPKLHTNYIDKTFYELTSNDLSNSTPQTFTIPRPGVNIERVVTRQSYYVSSSAKDEHVYNFLNKKGTYTFGGNGTFGKYKVQILDSSIIFTITQNPQTFFGWDFIEFNERVYGLVGANKNPIYNPKLLNSDYRALRLTNERGSQFEYDIQKLNTEIVQTEITEQFTADLQRTYFRARNTDGVYQRECEQNLTGLVETAETSIPLSTNYTKQVLSEQPNYFNQRNLGLITNVLHTGIGGAIAGGGAGAAVGAGLSLGTELISAHMSADNMNQHPNMIQNANGNVLFNLGYTTPGPTIEQYALLPQEERIINDQMFANGYNYNRIDQIRNFLHTRKYFNTIKAQLETIGGIPLSKAVRDDLKMRLANGLRLWHTDNIQYDLENYELWLEEE